MRISSAWASLTRSLPDGVSVMISIARCAIESSGVLHGGGKSPSGTIGTSCALRWKRVFPSLTGEARGYGWRTLRGGKRGDRAVDTG